MLRPLIIIRKIPNIDFMGWHKVGFALSALLTIGSIVLFLVEGLNYGIDFSGGTLMEVRTLNGPADLAQMRGTLNGIRLGDVSLQQFGGPRSEEHTSELQSHSELVCRLLLEKKKTDPGETWPHTRRAPAT